MEMHGHLERQVHVKGSILNYNYPNRGYIVRCTSLVGELSDYQCLYKTYFDSLTIK